MSPTSLILGLYKDFDLVSFVIPFIDSVESLSIFLFYFSSFFITKKCCNHRYLLISIPSLQSLQFIILTLLHISHQNKSLLI